MRHDARGSSNTKEGKPGTGRVGPPSLSLPKGGGAIRGIGEKFAANPVTGTASLNVPIFSTPGRSGFTPQLSLAYDSGSGNGPFGFGWSLSVPRIARKTDKGLPRYWDGDESDVFILSEAEDLVPVLRQDGTRDSLPRNWAGALYTVQRYRPRIEGLFARIERWRNSKTGDTHWRAISKDNVTSVYGDTPESRIADPHNQDNVFSWLLARSYDDKGNVIGYSYKAEDQANVPAALHEQNRTVGAQRYLKRISYGSQTPYYPAQDGALPTDWHNQLVFDYGEHEADVPQVDEARGWTCRPDPFSSYRAGFEIRTYRRCERALMFHRFPELGVTPCLVRSTDFSYKEEGSSQPAASLVASFIESITQVGYVREGSGYRKRAFPPLEFTYSEVAVDETVRTVDDAGLENLPEGLDGTRYQWIDLDGEGVGGVLAAQGDAWFRKRNRPVYEEDGSAAKAGLEALELVATLPSLADLAGRRQQLIDLAGEGRLCLVDFRQPDSGFYERTAAGQWEPFVPFHDSPNLDWSDRNLRMVDLTGDGHTDILVAGDEVLTWHPSRAKDGFGPAATVSWAGVEEQGPRLVFSDSTQSIHLADMSGDGLTDLVRVRNGEICYWPNLGYGRFGAKVTMSNAPVFDEPDQFEQRRILLADIDGSGSTDIIYLGRDSVCLYFNRSGNSWSAGRELTCFPVVDNLASILAMDLLGSGTACLVWSSPLPAGAHEPLRYVDLMGGQKPHLLTAVKNNIGAETRIRYAPSTKFYLKDRLSGKPWITKLPFPVHVVEQVETFDRVSETKLATRYAYHHGYFDAPEREFRGFGCVEQWDAVALSKYSGAGLFTETPKTAGDEFHLAPVHTVTWFHTGAFVALGNISKHFEEEYYDGDPSAWLLDDTILPPDGLSTREAREACRALKGRILRQEVYADDGTQQSAHPYTVTEYSYGLRRLQPLGDNRHAVFYAYECEALAYHYERNPADPRISHQLTLAVDDFGNVTRAAAVGYPRRAGATRQTEQEQTLITYTESDYTESVDTDDVFRAPLVCDVRTYELRGVSPPAGRPFQPDKLLNAAAQAEGRPYVERLTGASLRKRLIEEVRTLYYQDDLSGPLPISKPGSLGLVFETYQLAFTPELLDATFVVAGKATAAELNALLKDEGGYVAGDDYAARGWFPSSDAAGLWWIPSGQMAFSPVPSQPPPAKRPQPLTQDVTYARKHWFLPQAWRDPFDAVTRLGYDAYDLLLARTDDPAENVTAAVSEYRVMQPLLVTDPNGNRSEARFDALGMVIATAVMGKSGTSEGDSLASFTEAPPTTPNPVANPHAYLQKATSRFFINLDNFKKHGQPVYTHTIVRETHESDLAAGATTKVQHSFTYIDGFSREALKMVQAEPGRAPQRDAQGKLVHDANGKLAYADTSPNLRWVGSGRSVYDNKGNAVKKYEPFFDSHYGFTSEKELVEWGVTPILRYDPLGRLVRTDNPNGTYSEVLFDAWQQATWDENDTVEDSRWYDERRQGQKGVHERAAADKAKKHSDTPALTHLDPLGRRFLTVADNGPDLNGAPQQYETRIELDIEGNQRAVIDALGRTVMTYDYDMLGHRTHQSGMENGERWILNNAAGNPIRRWDSRGHTVKTSYDALQRPTHVFVQRAGAAEILVERLVYGEKHTDTGRNLRGHLYQHYDGAGGARNERFDFKGNLTERSRQLAYDYKNTRDWSALAGLIDLDAIANAATSALDLNQHFTSRTTYDALNRPVMVVTPHNGRILPSIIQPAYNPAGLLDKIDVWVQEMAPPAQPLNASGATLHAVTNIDYNEKGQRTLIAYGSGVRTEYTYDAETFRLARIKTTRPNTFPSNKRILQDLSYTFDGVGNITHIQDDADIQNTIFFRNQRVEPSADYTYDPMYRLIEATGREHLGLTNGVLNAPQQRDHEESFRIGLPHPGDGRAVATYIERYSYDAVGNILSLVHQAAGSGWTRRYACNEASLIESSKKSNRLSATSLPGDGPLGPYSAKYAHDAHGNMTAMPHLSTIAWDYEDQMESADLGGGGKVYFVYDAAGERVRKVHEHLGGAVEERVYLGEIELYRKRSGAGLTLERETLHVMDGERRIGIVETKTADATAAPGSLPSTLTRYQHDNHLGSAVLELDESAAVLSYEEYFPYGNTSYQAVRTDIEVSPKRYRYTGKERDEETGLAYHRARYYAPWLGRWVSCDPAGLVGGLNLYQYCRGAPAHLLDEDGTQPSGALDQALASYRIAEAEYVRTRGAFLESMRYLSEARTTLTQALTRASVLLEQTGKDLRRFPEAPRLAEYLNTVTEHASRDYAAAKRSFDDAYERAAIDIRRVDKAMSALRKAQDLVGRLGGDQPYPPRIGNRGPGAAGGAPAPPGTVPPSGAAGGTPSRGGPAASGLPSPAPGAILRFGLGVLGRALTLLAVKQALDDERARNVARGGTGMTTREQADARFALLARRDPGMAARIQMLTMSSPLSFLVGSVTGWDPAIAERDWRVNKYFNKQVEAQRQQFPNLPRYPTIRQGP